MLTRRQRLICLILLSLITRTHAFSSGEFLYPHEITRTVIEAIVKEHCFNITLLPPQHRGEKGTRCILDHLDEVSKSEMAICSVMLGLLPIALQMIGPKVNEISVLAMKRPFMGLCMSLGSPCATLEHERTGLEESVEQDPLWPDYLRHRRVWKVALVSAIQFIIVGGAAVNSIILGYELSYYSVQLISMYLGRYGSTQEAFSPLLWVFCSIPPHFIGSFIVYSSMEGEEARGEGGSAEISLVRRTSAGLMSWLAQECTPCAYQKPLKPTQNAKTVHMRYRLLILNWIIKLLVWVQVIFGLFVLSSTLFVSLWSSFRIISRFLIGSLACRLVLAFELYGLHQISRKPELIS